MLHCRMFDLHGVFDDQPGFQRARAGWYDTRVGTLVGMSTQVQSRWWTVLDAVVLRSLRLLQKLEKITES